MKEALKRGLDALLSRRVYLQPGGNKETRLIQRALLSKIYPDYYAPHHEIFVEGYNRESEILAQANYQKERGIA